VIVVFQLGVVGAAVPTVAIVTAFVAVHGTGVTRRVLAVVARRGVGG
jgi:hypothetical protein